MLSNDSADYGNRRSFLRRAAATVGASCFGATAFNAAAFHVAKPAVAAPAAAAKPSAPSLKGRLYKAAKWDMIQIDGSLRDKFQLQKELGYDGMELISPSSLDPAEVRAASAATSMPVHGVVDMKHWDVRLSSPDPQQRDEGREYLVAAIRDAHAFGGFSVLLVPGRVAAPDETHEQVWQRSIAQIRQVLPLASRLGVRVLVENVWNGFCETPDQMRDYLDEIDSPWVGAYFDIGNCRKFGRSEDWIRTLNRRIVKLDCKDWSAAGGFGKIGAGDVDWPAVRTALAEIGFSGWCTAEVAGGGRAELADISHRMNQVFDL